MDNQAQEFDIRCSNACTKAGAAALLLSAVALGMLQPLTKSQQLDAVTKYYSGRLALHDAINRLDKDPNWLLLLKDEKLGRQAAKEWTLDTILKYKVHPEGRPGLITKSKEEFLGEGVSMLASGMTLQAPRDIEFELTLLGDGSLLSHARGFSNQINRSIYRWTYLRTMIVLFSKGKRQTEIVTHFPDEKTAYVPSVTRDDLLALTIPEIIELASYEPVEETKLDALVRDDATLTLPSVGIPFNIIPAASLVEMALLLTSIYFWLYLREAKTSDNFPPSGTLFGVFSRSAPSRLVFRLLLLAPPVAAALLAYKTFWITPANVAPAVLIVLLGCVINLETRREQ
ncbi:MAG TPA: hypothetical protein VGH16_05615 [Candidatus Binatia bacterium]|jgi:hypothetical protein